MKIRLADYTDGERVSVEDNYNAGELDLEFVDFHYQQPIQLSGNIEKGGDAVIFRGNLSSEIEHVCGRCLKTMNEKINIPFHLVYDTAGKEEIDTLPDIRETLLLEHPLSFLCSESCKGLCPHCGIDRNQEKCDCESKFHSQSLQELGKIWKIKKEDSNHA